MTGNPSVSVILVTYNPGPCLARCLESLDQQTFSDFEVIVIDNASTDGFVRQDELPDRVDRFIGRDDNTGFAAACNLGAREAAGSWLAFLNPDAFPAPNWLAELVAATRRYPTVPAFASKQVMADDPNLLDGAGDNYFFAGFPWRGGYGQAEPAVLPEGRVFSACGAATLVRRDAFLGMSGFDEALFCYCEDVDFGFRLQLEGAETVFVPSAVVEHVGSVTLGRSSPKAIELGTRNRIWVLVKNMPWPLLGLALLAHAGIFVFLLLRYRGLDDGAEVARAALRGARIGVKGIPQALHRRREVQARRTASWWQVARSMSWSPWTFHRRGIDIR